MSHTSQQIFNYLIVMMQRSAPALGLFASLLTKCVNEKSYNEGNTSVRLGYSSSEQIVLPTAQTTAVKQNAFVAVYDKQTRNPKYVIERLYKDSLLCADDEDALNKKKKRKPFFVETSIEDDIFRSNTKDYTNVPYDRGHMAPAADFICNPDMRDATFTMANVCPQAPAMNKGFWAKFEAWLRYQLTHGQYEEMIVITGPVYAPMYVNNEWVRVNRTIGTFPKLVHVPTHFFKLVVCLKKQPGSSTKAIVPYTGSSSSSTSSGGSSAMVVYDAQTGACREWWPTEGAGQSIAVAAFLVPNSDSVDAKTTLSSVSVRIEQLEAIVGYKLLPEALNGKVKQKLDSAVPSTRDLALVLNALSQPSELIFTNGKTALLLPRTDTTPSTNNPVKVSGSENISQGKNTLSQVGLVSVQHLCEQVDCNKALFSKQ